MSDPELRQVLRSLPREAASEGFTEEVLARAARLPVPGAAAGEPGRVVSFPRRLPGWPGWLMAAAALLIFGLGMREWQHRRDVEESMRRIAELRGQYQELASELESLRREAASARPVVYVGGTEQVDLVVDLAKLAEKRKDPQSEDPAARRAAQEELAELYRQGADSAPLY
jgi:hypothetical protein